MKITKIISAFLATMMLLSVCTIGISAEEKLPFTDVIEGEWYYDAVKYVYKNGLMNGTGDGTKFSPSMNLTRGMVVTVLYRMEGSPMIFFKDIFADVSYKAYYADAVEWAKSNMIVNGTGYDEWGEEYFSPDRDILGGLAPH